MGYKDNLMEWKKKGLGNSMQIKRNDEEETYTDNLLKEDLKTYVKRGNEDQRGRSGKENDRFNAF